MSRQYNVMFRADNVLNPAVIKEMYKMSQKMRAVTFGTKKWSDICLRVPIIAPPSCLDSKKSLTKDCEDFKMPNLSASDVSLLIPAVKRLQEEGFSPELGVYK